MKSHSRWCPWLIYVISFTTSIISATLVEKSTSTTYFSIVAVYLLGSIVLYDNEMTLRELYHHHITQEEQLLIKLKSQNDQEILLIKEQQLRLLFGNIVHDLKSPLQAFTMELGLLQDILTSSSSFSAAGLPPSLSTELPSTQPATTAVEPSSLTRKEGNQIQFEAQKSIEMLQSICSFMLMTINRAVDYSKVSSGIHLVPSLKVVNLSKTISWVLKMVETAAASIVDQDKQQLRLRDSEVLVVTEPFPSNLCLNILTDPQWLRENLLCLVSNAQKFTSVGKITIRCFLEFKENHDPQAPPLFCHGISQRSYQKILSSSALYPLTNGSNPISRGPSADRQFRFPLGTPSPSHRSSSTTQFQYLRVEVEDTGIGIEPNERGKIFQPFRASGNPYSHSGGTGLGLHSVLKRVESLGGHCGVTTRRDRQRGSCFWFTILPPQLGHLLRQEWTHPH